MVLENYVKLEREKEKVLKVKPGSFRVEEATITDPITKKPKRVRKAVIDVVEEDYRPVVKVFSTLSDKLATSLAQMHENGDLYRYHLGITWHPGGYATEYTPRLF
jgi:hypothetical protein